MDKLGVLAASRVLRPRIERRQVLPYRRGCRLAPRPPQANNWGTTPLASARGRNQSEVVALLEASCGDGGRGLATACQAGRWDAGVLRTKQPPPPCAHTPTLFPSSLDAFSLIYGHRQLFIGSKCWPLWCGIAARWGQVKHAAAASEKDHLRRLLCKPSCAGCTSRHAPAPDRPFSRSDQRNVLSRTTANRRMHRTTTTTANAAPFCLQIGPFDDLPRSITRSSRRGRGLN